MRLTFFLASLLCLLANAKDLDVSNVTQEDWKFEAAAYTRKTTQAPLTLLDSILKQQLEPTVALAFIVRIFPCFDGADVESALEYYEASLRRNPELTLQITAESLIPSYEELSDSNRACLEEDNRSSVFASALRSMEHSAARENTSFKKIKTLSTYQIASQRLLKEPSYKRVLSPVLLAIESVY